MKLISTFIALADLSVIANANNITPADSSPRALSGGSVNAARNMPTTNNIATNLDNGINDIALDVNVVRAVPGYIIDKSCRPCSTYVTDCFEDCKGGDRQSCDDYCSCEGLLSKACQDRDCRKMFKQYWNQPYINEDFCPQGGEQRP